MLWANLTVGTGRVFLFFTELVPISWVVVGFTPFPNPLMLMLVFN